MCAISAPVEGLKTDPAVAGQNAIRPEDRKRCGALTWRLGSETTVTFPLLSSMLVCSLTLLFQ